MGIEAGPIVLASGSPRRRELLGLLGVKFEVVVSEVDEDSPEHDPERLARSLSLQKAEAVAQLRPNAIILAADTVVALDGQCLGKPRDPLENAEFLRRLQGQTHQVVTGVTLLTPELRLTRSELTVVTFRPLSDPEITFYAQTGEGLDKAGGYGIQGLGMALVSSIQGDYSNVVGFPLFLVIRLLRQSGVLIWDENSYGS